MDASAVVMVPLEKNLCGTLDRTRVFIKNANHSHLYLIGISGHCRGNGKTVCFAREKQKSRNRNSGTQPRSGCAFRRWKSGDDPA